MIDHLLAFLFPERCIGCNAKGYAACTQCTQHIPFSDTIANHPNSFAIYDYGDPIVRKAMWELKYHRKSGAVKALVQYGIPNIIDYLAETLQGSTSMSIVLVPIPQYYAKTLSRGFNQSRLIAKWMKPAFPDAKILGVLKKNRSTNSQALAHNRLEREKNLAHSMEINKTYYPLNPHALYIVVDDVITTGSTITEASRALRAAGAKHICAIAVAHGYARK